MSNINKQALREAAEKATPGEWWIDSHGMAMVAHHNDNTMIVFVTDGEQMGKAIRHEDTGNLSHWRNDNDASFIATANPATVLALLDELEAMHKYAKDRDAENEGLMLTVGRLRVEKEASEKRIAELEASHINLREAMAGIHNTITGGGAYTPLAAILNASKRAYEESAAAAAKGE